MTFDICLCETNNSLMNEHLLHYKVGFAFKRAKLNKAVGIDGMPNEMFKNIFSIEFVSELSNLVYRNANIPQNWCTAIIKPISKYSSIDIIDLIV